MRRTWTNMLYQYFAIKAFTPFLSFMIPYLVEKKGFCNRELHNNFSPFFFLSSVMTSLIAFLVIEFLGSRLSIFVDTFSEMLVYLIFMFMPFRSYCWTFMAYTLHGATTSMNVVMKSIVIDTADERANKGILISTTSGIKTFVGVLSSWVGQDIIICGGTHFVNMTISLVSLLASLGIIFFLPTPCDKASGDGFISHLKSPREMMKKIADAYTEKAIVMSLLSSSASILYVCLSFYSSGIFLEMRRSGVEADVRVNKTLFFIAMPLRVISYIFIKIFSRFDSTVSYRSNLDKPIIIYGYIEGYAKILSSLVGMYVSRFISEENCAPLTFITTLTTMCLICLLGTSDSMTLSYLFYVLGSLSSSTCKTIANIGLVGTKEYRFLLSMNLFASSVIHIFITCYSKVCNLDVKSKLMVYFYVNSVLFVTAVALYCKLKAYSC